MAARVLRVFAAAAGLAAHVVLAGKAAGAHRSPIAYLGFQRGQCRSWSFRMEALVFAFISDSIIILSDMSTLFSAPSRRSGLLWRAFWRALQPLRPACSRSTTFLWLVVVLAALCLRPDLAGVTSLVRALGFRTPAITACCTSFIPRPWMWPLDPTVAQTLAALAAGAAGAGQRTAGGAGGWHQAAQGGQEDAGGQKPASGVPLQRQGVFHHGSSLQAVALLAQAAGVYLAVPVAARIHEGLVWSNRDRRTLLDKLARLAPGAAVG